MNDSQHGSDRPYPPDELAEKYGVSPTTIRSVLNGRRWDHLPSVEELAEAGV